MKVRKGDDVHKVELDPGLLHILVFGPNTGEAIIVMLPKQDRDVAPRIGVVDGVPGGCVSRWISQRLGDAQRPLFACLTHPHEDHYRGFAEMIEGHPPEHLWWAGDEEGRFFQAWAELYATPAGKPAERPSRTKIDELRETLDASLNTRRDKTRHRTLADRKRLLSHGRVEVDGLLPTTSEKYDKLCAMIRAPKDAARDGESVNDLSGAITLRWGETRVLLGGDCNAGASATHCGWAGHGEQTKRFTLVKVPHHGSHTAQHDESARGGEIQVGVLTPFQAGNAKQPPKSEELAWWKERTSSLFMTAPKEHMRATAEPVFASSVRRKADSAVLASLGDEGNVVEVVLFGDATRVE